MRFFTALIAAFIITGCTVDSVHISPAMEARLKARAVSADRIGLRFDKDGTRYSMQVFSARLNPEPIAVPMLKSYGGLPAVKVQLNDASPLQMIADTGAQLCVVEPRRALAAGADVYAGDQFPIRVTGIGGEEKAWLARFDRAAFGGIELHQLITILRREKTRVLAGRIPMAEYEVNLLGGPVLCGFRYVTFDYPARRIVFSPGTDFTPSPGATRIPLKVRDHLLYVPLTIGSHRIDAMVDTGAKDQIFLNQSLVRRWGYATLAERGRAYRAAGLGGMTTGRSFEVPLVFIGQLPLRNLTVDTAGGAWQARIGTELLKRWRVTFDFKRRAMWLESPVQR